MWPPARRLFAWGLAHHVAQSRTLDGREAFGTLAACIRAAFDLGVGPCAGHRQITAYAPCAQS